MATPTRSTNPRSSDAETTLLLLALGAFLVAGGLARWAEFNATVRAILNWLTLPLLQLWVSHSPGMDAFLRRSTLSTWLLIQAAMVVVPCGLAAGLYLMLTHDHRRLRRMARKQLFAKRENARLNEMAAEMEAKEQQSKRGQPRAGGSNPPHGEAATDAERLKDVFRQRRPE